jgi:hypothetical protein
MRPSTVTFTPELRAGEQVRERETQTVNNKVD